MVRESDISKKMDVTYTFDHEIIFSKRIKEEFSKRNIQNLELRPVHSVKDGKFLNCYQLIPKSKLPPFSKTSKGVEIENRCKKCKLDGYYWKLNTPLVLHYHNFDESILKRSDIFFTHEHFGNSALREPFNESKFALPLYVCGPKIFEIFNDLKIKEIKFEPVIVNGYPDLDRWKK